MDHLLNFIAGMGNALALAPERDYVRPRGGFAKDVARLRTDSGKVAQGMSKSIKKHGEQINHRAR